MCMSACECVCVGGRGDRCVCAYLCALCVVLGVHVRMHACGQACSHACDGHTPLCACVCLVTQACSLHNLQEMVDCMEGGRLVLYPQLLLATIALLPVSYVHIFILAMDLFSKVPPYFRTVNAVSFSSLLTFSDEVTEEYHGKSTPATLTILRLV